MWHHPDLHGAVQEGLPVQSGTLHHPHEQVVHQVIYCTHMPCVFLGSSMAWCLGKAYNPRCHQGIFQPPKCTTEARWQKAREAHPKGAARKRPHPSLRVGVKKWSFSCSKIGMIHTLGPPILGFPIFFNDGSQPPSLRRQWGVRGYFTTRFPGTSTCEGILTTSFLWWQRQIL